MLAPLLPISNFRIPNGILLCWKVLYDVMSFLTSPLFHVAIAFLFIFRCACHIRPFES